MRWLALVAALTLCSCTCELKVDTGTLIVQTKAPAQKVLPPPPAIPGHPWVFEERECFLTEAGCHRSWNHGWTLVAKSPSDREGVFHIVMRRYLTAEAP